MCYTYEEYRAHLEATRAFAETHINYNLQTRGIQAFRNIQIQILEDHLVVVSKNKAPTIQFVIRHPNMVSALQNFVPPVDMTENRASEKV